MTIFLQEIVTPSPYVNSSPRITGYTVSDYTIEPGGTVSLSVTAEDPDVSDTLTYAWTAASGSFSVSDAASTVWTAPMVTGSVVLNIGVSDPSGATATLSLATGPDPCDGTICGPDINPPGTLVWDSSQVHSGFSEPGDALIDPISGYTVTAFTGDDGIRPHIIVEMFDRDNPAFSYSRPFTQESKAFAVASDSAGGGYIAGWMEGDFFLEKQNDTWSNSGWSVKIAGTGAYDVEVDSADNPWVVGFTTSGTASSLYIGRFDSETGSPLISTQPVQGTFYEGAGLAISSSQHVIICASQLINGDYDLWLGKFDMFLKPVWTTTWTHTGTTEELCEDVAVDGQGNIIVAGSLESGGDADTWVAVFDATGQFIDEYLPSGPYNESARSVDVGTNGYIYAATDSSGANVQVLALNPFGTLGTPLWNSTLAASLAGGLSLTESGYILCSGISGSSSWIGILAH